MLQQNIKIYFFMLKEMVSLTLQVIGVQLTTWRHIYMRNFSIIPRSVFPPNIPDYLRDSGDPCCHP